MLQSFDSVGNGIIEAVGTVTSSKEHAVTDGAAKLTVANWGAVYIFIKIDGKIPTLEDFAEYEYIQMNIYASVPATFYFHSCTKTVALKAGENVMRMKMADILEYLATNPAGYNTTSGYLFFQFGGMEAGTHDFWVDNLIAIKGFKDNDYPELPEDLDYDVLQSFEMADTAEVQSVDESEKLIPNTFEAGTSTTTHVVKDNAVSFNTIRKNHQFRIKLVKEDGTVYTAEELAAYDQLWLHVYVQKDLAKNDANISIGESVASGLGYGAHVIKIDVEKLLEVLDTVYDEEGWLTFTVSNGAQKYTITVDELIGVRLPESAGGEESGSEGEGTTENPAASVE